VVTVEEVALPVEVILKKDVVAAVLHKLANPPPAVGKAKRAHRLPAAAVPVAGPLPCAGLSDCCRAPLLTSAAAVLDAAVTESQVAEVINATLDIIKETLVKGGKVQLTGCVAR